MHVEFSNLVTHFSYLFLLKLFNYLKSNSMLIFILISFFLDCPMYGINGVPVDKHYDDACFIFHEMLMEEASERKKLPGSEEKSLGQVLV